jgi:hypothetical protein
MLFFTLFFPSISSVVHGCNQAYTPKEPRFETVNVNNPNDVHYIFGSSGNTITWDIESTGPLSPLYIISRNGTQILHSSGITAVINIDGLETGVYEYTIYVYSHHGVSSDSDIVMVFVELHPNPLVQLAIENHLLISVAISSFLMFVGVLTIMMIRKKRK